MHGSPNRAAPDVSPRPAAVEPLEGRRLMAAAPPALVAKVPEAAGYQLVYDLNVPKLGGSYNATAVPYAVNDAAKITRKFDRVAYHLQLTRADGSAQWVYVSAAAFTADAKKLGVPTVASGAVFQQKLSDMTVRSNVAGVVTGSKLGGGNVEFWPNAYAPGNAANVAGASPYAYDFGDAITGPAAGYGSMQIHNAAARQTVLAYNGWGGLEPAKNAEIGIGNSPTGGTDWTTNKSAGNWAVRRLQVLVRPAAAATVPPTVPPPVVPPTVPTPTYSLGRVLAIGDSITRGYDKAAPAGGGYRSKLYAALRSAGETMKFVGSVKDDLATPLVRDGQQAHEGHGGYRTDQILGNLFGAAYGTPTDSNNGGHWLDGTGTRAAVNPDAVLLMIGTNDVLQKKSVDVAAGYLDRIVKTITTARPNAKLFISTILPITNYPEFQPKVKAYNVLVKQVAARYAAAGKKVVLVDQYKAFVDAVGAPVKSLLADGVHPNQAGYQKMATTWAQAIRAAKRA